MNYNNPSFTSALFDCAYECAVRRRDKKCWKQLHSHACWECRFYIKKYIQASDSDIELFMMQAEQKAAIIKVHQTAYRPIFIVIIILIIAIGIMMHRKEQERTIRFNENFSTSLNHNDNTPELIERTMQTITRALKNGIDVNGDGLTNCIDAAVLFYQHYPDRSKVKIMQNINNNTGMKHLFVYILMNGVWTPLEPRAYYDGHKTYWMRPIWGSIYDSSKDNDVTYTFIKYVK